MTTTGQHRQGGAAAPVASCPACRVPMAALPRCPSCGFTGGDTHRLFPGVPPALQEVTDPIGLWDARDLQGIAAVRRRLARRYPQFRWHLATVDLPPDTNLALYGFWLLNVAPLAEGQVETDRLWTVLLLIHPAAERAAAVPGYLAEPWLPDDKLDRALAAMQPEWHRGSPGRAVAEFFSEIHRALDTGWKQHAANTQPHD